MQLKESKLTIITSDSTSPSSYVPFIPNKIFWYQYIVPIPIPTQNNSYETVWRKHARNTALFRFLYCILSMLPLFALYYVEIAQYISQNNLYETFRRKKTQNAALFRFLYCIISMCHLFAFLQPLACWNWFPSACPSNCLRFHSRSILKQKRYLVVSTSFKRKKEQVNIESQ